MSQFKAD
jgi:hypothetical protein